MSRIDYDNFLKWCVERFGEENLKFRKGGREICTHSFFVDGHADYPDGDHKFKLWFNPDGGKSERSGGVYRCWLTDNRGSLIRLVSEFDSIAYEDAEDLICNQISLRALEEQVHALFQQKPEPEPEPITNIALPDACVLISETQATSYYGEKSRAYLAKRKIPIDGLYVCVEGDCNNRIVIPYYNTVGELVYYNARTMSEKSSVLRYMKPDPSVALQSRVLFSPTWPAPRSKIYLTEGEFDAIVLNLLGFSSVACGGKYLSETQTDMLRQYQIVLAFDNDAAGIRATNDIGMSLLEQGFTGLRMVTPHKIAKDWNDLLVKKDIPVVRQYIVQREKRFDPDIVMNL